jgi:hypothetical protein
MSQKRHTVDQIISKLRRADVLLGKGTKVAKRYSCARGRRSCSRLRVMDSAEIPMSFPRTETAYRTTTGSPLASS